MASTDGVARERVRRGCSSVFFLFSWGTRRTLWFFPGAIPFFFLVLVKHKIS